MTVLAVASHLKKTLRSRAARDNSCLQSEGPRLNVEGSRRPDSTRYLSVKYDAPSGRARLASALFRFHCPASHFAHLKLEPRPCTSRRRWSVILSYHSPKQPSQ